MTKELFKKASSKDAFEFSKELAADYNNKIMQSLKDFLGIEGQENTEQFTAILGMSYHIIVMILRSYLRALKNNVSDDHYAELLNKTLDQLIGLK